MGPPSTSSPTASSSSPSIDGGLGQHVIVEHTIDGQKVQSVYGHLIFGSQTVNVGRQGDARRGARKRRQHRRQHRPHLHFEIRPGGGEAVEPLGWLAKNVTEDWVS